MIDLELFRKSPEIFKKEAKKRNMKLDVDSDVELDKKRRDLIFKVDEIRAKKNKASKDIAKLKGSEKKEAIDSMKELNIALDKLEEELKDIEGKFKDHMADYPNITHESVPVGKDEKSNEILYLKGEKPDFEFEVKNHLELGTELDIIDEKKATEISGSRFVFLKNDAALLQFALIRFVLDILTGEGFTPLIPPVLVKEEAMYGTGFFPVEKTQYYKTELDDLYLIGTSEVPLCAYHMGDTLEKEVLPLKYTAYSTCFRREAGSYGKDLGGLFRVHQFDKIEMFIFAGPEDSWEEFERLRDILERIYTLLGIHYRIMNMCTGDIGNPNAKKYDLEAWLPGQGRYRELASCSHDTDYQSRRLNIKFKDNTKKELVHTMNSTACAVGRTLIAIIENYQKEDGSIEIPEPLIPYMNKKAIS